MRSLVILLLAIATASHALHQESPGALRLTSGPPHVPSAGRAWGNWLAFTSTQDLAGLGATRAPGVQVFVFNIAYYDCAQGSTLPTTPCPAVGTPFLKQVTNGIDEFANPSVSQTPSGSTTPFDVWVAFDALGSYNGSTGTVATHRQIFLKHLVTNEVRQVTAASDGDSVRPSLSSTAGIVTFESTAMLAGFPNPAGVSQVFAYERQTNVLRQLSLGPAPLSKVGLGPSSNAMPNDGGDGIAFESTADLLGDGTDTGVSQIFWSDYDRQSHVSTLRQVTAGNGPSRNPFPASSPKVVVFDSVATNLPGTGGLAGRNVYQVAITDPPAASVGQVTTSALFGDCSVPALDPGGDRVVFFCTGDPLQNATLGPRLFVLDRTTTVLYQLTGLGIVTGRPAANLGQWFVAVVTSSDLTGSGSCTTQLHVIDYFAGRWAAATQLGQYPADVTGTNACGGNCTTAADCGDQNPCNGTETCGVNHICARGTPIVCSDGDVCNGVETCNPATGTCVGGTPLVCADGNPCTDDACHPAAACTFTANAAPCDDGTACTVGDVCAYGVCAGTPVACPSCERCDAATGACASGPRTGCVAGAGVRAALRLAKAPVATSDLLAWKWRWPSGQPANFGNPIMTDDYALCVYDAADALVLRSDAPAGAICSGASCWAAKPGGSFVYRDPSGTPSGLVRLLLKTKPTGGAKLGLKGRGANLGVPSPAELDLPLRTQLHAGGSRCFEAAFAPVQVQRQDATQLKAKLP